MRLDAAPARSRSAGQLLRPIHPWKGTIQMPNLGDPASGGRVRGRGTLGVVELGASSSSMSDTAAAWHG